MLRSKTRRCMGTPCEPVTSVAVSHGSPCSLMISRTHPLFVSAIESGASPDRGVPRAPSVMKGAAPVVVSPFPVPSGGAIRPVCPDSGSTPNTFTRQRSPYAIENDVTSAGLRVVHISNASPTPDSTTRGPGFDDDPAVLVVGDVDPHLRIDLGRFCRVRCGQWGGDILQAGDERLDVVGDEPGGGCPSGRSFDSLAFLVVSAIHLPTGGPPTTGSG